MSKRCAYLTMESHDGWQIDADLAFPHMVELGWEVEPVAWRRADCDWNQFSAIYVGTSWDYPEAPEQFLSLLREIDSSTAILINSLALVEWNLSKTYLRDLEEQGAAIVPSLWMDEYSQRGLDQTFSDFGVDRIIVKPVVSTNARHTYKLSRESAARLASELQDVFAACPFVVQPFVDNILEEGEFSLFYLGESFSHAIRKVPARGDFRVQEEYGAELNAVTPANELRAAADQVLSLVNPMPAYARADFVRDADGRFLLMELELIEPSMYLRMDESAPRRFAIEFDNYYKRATGGAST